MSAPWYHERAIELMRLNPGMGYDAAVRRVSGKAPDHKPVDPAAVEFLLANPGASGEEALSYAALATSKPADVMTYSAGHQPSDLHTRAMSILRANPGMDYDRAEQLARGR